MFKLTNQSTVDRTIFECNYIPYTPQSLSTVNGETKQVYNLPKIYTKKIVQFIRSINTVS